MMPANPPRFFIKGIWQQPSFDTWKLHGLNTAIEVPDGTSIDQWTAKAQSAGFSMIRRPRDNPANDIGQQGLLAWALPDEPSNTTDGTLAVGHVAIDPAAYEAMAAALRAHGNIPIFSNMVGNHVNDLGAALFMFQYASDPFVDWLGHDVYPVNNKQPLAFDFEGSFSTHQGHAIDRLSAWSLGKLQIAFVEVGSYSGGPQVTPEQFRIQAWSSVIHGAAGICYFSIQLAPTFAWNNMPPIIGEEMKSLHSSLTEIEPFLMNQLKGGRSPSTIWRSALKGNTPAKGQMPYPFEACELKIGNRSYSIILNLSLEPAMLNFAPLGIYDLKFKPAEVMSGYYRR